MSSIQLGLGLLSIGRSWGVGNIAPPSERDACELIEVAFEHGVRFFDTAPAYARSEAIFGRALGINPSLASECVVATKLGEHWDSAVGQTWVSHARDDLLRSLERSLAVLGRIDVLQLHKASASNVLSDAVLSVFEFAKKVGVRKFGASVSDIETAQIACQSGQYDFLQFPFSSQNRTMEGILALLPSVGMKAIINRPLAMGALADGSQGAVVEAFRFARHRVSSGVILTGTSSKTHLFENIAAFEIAGR